jgi:hypothetical protein
MDLCIKSNVLIGRASSRHTALCLQQGDDKMLIVWRTEDWTPIARVTEPFQRWLTLAFSLR